MTAVVYTDASYNHYKKIAACGYCIVLDGELIKHEVQLYENVLTPTYAEVLSIVHGLQDAFMIKGVKLIAVNSDCKSISVSINNYGGKRRNLKKYDAFKELNETILMCKENNIGVTVNHIKGHSVHQYNNMVDLSCKTNLRKYLKTKHGT